VGGGLESRRAVDDSTMMARHGYDG
jgi:hypothetical protein